MGVSWKDKAYSYIVQDSKISNSQVSSLATSAITNSIKNLDNINYFSNSINEILNKCDSRYIISILYLVDGIFKELNKKYPNLELKKTKEIFQRFNTSFSTMLQQNEKKILETTPEQDCRKLVKLLQIWLTRNDFDQHSLKKWIFRISTDLNIDINNLDEIPTTTTTTTTNSKKREYNDNNGNFNIEDILEPTLKYQKIDNNNLSGLNNLSISGNTSKSVLLNENLIYLLPIEMMFEILSYLTVIDLVKVSKVSKYFLCIINNLPSCTNISFENLIISSQDITRTIIQFNSIHSINFSFNRFVTNDNLIIISKYCSLLDKVSISGCTQLEFTSIIKLIENLKFLKVFKMSQINNNSSTISSSSKRTKTIDHSKTLFNLLFNINNNNLKKLDISCCHSLIYLLLQYYNEPLSTSIQYLNIDCYCSKLDISSYSAGFINVFNNLPFLKSINSLYKPSTTTIIDHINIKVNNIWKMLVQNDTNGFESLLLEYKTKYNDNNKKFEKLINRRYYLGTTSIYMACKNGNFKAIDLLMLTNQVDIKIADYNGISPILISNSIFTVLKLHKEWNVQANSEFEKLFINVCEILNKYYLFLNIDSQARPDFTSPNSNDDDNMMEFDQLLTCVLKAPSLIWTNEIIKQCNILICKFIKNFKFFQEYVKSCQSNVSRSHLLTQSLKDDDFYEKTNLSKMMSKEYEKRILMVLYGYG